MLWRQFWLNLCNHGCRKRKLKYFDTTSGALKKNIDIITSAKYQYFFSMHHWWYQYSSTMMKSNIFFQCTIVGAHIIPIMMKNIEKYHFTMIYSKFISTNYGMTNAQCIGLWFISQQCSVFDHTICILYSGYKNCIFRLKSIHYIIGIMVVKSAYSIT